MTEHTAEPAPVSDLDEWIAGGQRPRLSVPLCLAGNLRADYDEKHRQLAEMPDLSQQTMADRATVRRGIEELEQLRERMEAATRVLVLEALDPNDYNRLLAKHPARDGNRLDRAYGANVDAWFPALISACCVEPAISPEQVQALRPKLSAAQWDHLTGAAFAVNRSQVNVPKSLTSSAGTPSSDER